LHYVDIVWIKREWFRAVRSSSDKTLARRDLPLFNGFTGTIAQSDMRSNLFESICEEDCLPGKLFPVGIV